MKTYQFDEALNAINETNNEHLNILCFYQTLKTELCQDRLSDTRILEFYELSNKPYFANNKELITCLSKFNNHKVVDLESINLKDFENFAKQWTPYEKVTVVIDEIE